MNIHLLVGYAGVMRERNPESKKRRLLEAALAEFARRGLAATRIEDIAARAQCSSGLVYTYFGSKEALFDAVLGVITERAIAEVPMDAADLAGYARRLHETGAAHEDVRRFVAWYQLEQPGGRVPEADAAMTSKIDAIRAAQRVGAVRGDLDAPVIALAVQALARMWITEPEAVTATVDPRRDEGVRADAVHDVVTALLDGGIRARKTT